MSLDKNQLSTEQKAALYDLLRPEIRKLAHNMEMKFRMYDKERGNPFDCTDNAFLNQRLKDENAEFYNAIDVRSQPSKVWKEGSDCCNFRLMRIINYEKEWKEAVKRK
jgi:hypothetical protein